ncbi:transporter substrate-binding domain-containing protein [Kiloniella laminariae]|uniref:transporter substrate-binding domain-containing protein n=1 Tax=Kiloniella laminariae TaxID=454162 RepID=UPI00036E42DA|nr:transporter substrate-binding domain-containing protein [Kiloniella laminariae]
MSRKIPVGLLYSTTGAYSLLGQECLDGALLALDEINRSADYDFQLVPQIENPGANINEYQRLTEKMTRVDGCRQIIGTLTSISRKEIIPILEKNDALLWYVAPYEGFECCENVIYTGACPNQHIVPLFEHIIPRFGKNAYLCGTNYVWGWEVNRIARELVQACGGQVTGENYLPFHSRDVERMIETVRETRPNFILNNLIDDSSYALFRAYYSAGKTDSFFHPENCPIVSCNLTECELSRIGHDAAQGHLSISPYFEKIATAENSLFLDELSRKEPKRHSVSAFFINGYATTYYLAKAIKSCGSDDIDAVKQSVLGRKFNTPLGQTEINEKTHHTALPSYIGQINSTGKFDIVSAAAEAKIADPYLVKFDTAAFAKQISGQLDPLSGSHLKVIK